MERGYQVSSLSHIRALLNHDVGRIESINTCKTLHHMPFIFKDYGFHYAHLKSFDLKINMREPVEYITWSRAHK